MTFIGSIILLLENLNIFFYNKYLEFDMEEVLEIENNIPLYRKV
jgi:NADH:ubiquinone oxidoreductase subunit 4 (subunit M)